MRGASRAQLPRPVLLPVLEELAVTHPRVRVVISEYEPIEAFRLLVDDDLDLALTYDYNLAPSADINGTGNGLNNLLVGPGDLTIDALVSRMDLPVSIDVATERLPPAPNVASTITSPG